MATLNLGRVGFVNKGTWSVATAYKINDVIIYNSGTYAALQAHTGQTPASGGTAYWQEWIPSDSGVYVAGAINNATGKTTPVDADELALVDSADSNTLKKLTWSNLKATLKTYFDTLYVALAGDQTIAGIKTFSSSPILPTPTVGDNTTKGATTAFIQSAISDIKIQLSTQVSASGVAVDFTGIPTGAKRIEVLLSGVSTNGTSGLIVQIGDSGGIENTGYVGSSAAVANSTGFLINGGSTASAATYSGVISMSLTYEANNIWSEFGILGRNDGVATLASGGYKPLSAVLDRVRITTLNGTDTFDAGIININWEL